MKMQISVVVSSDDDAVSRGAAGGLMLATRVEGVDPDAAKQDFLSQAETLMRSISENQLPALYQTVLDECERKAKEDAAAKAEEAEQSNAVAAARVKLAQLRQKKGQAAQEQPEQPEQDEPEPPVQCTTCGATVPHDDAHFVSIVQNGQYVRDGVLCEACYQAEIRASKRQEQGEVQQ